VFAAVLLKIQAFWDVGLLVPEEGGTSFLRNVGNNLLVDIT
jgi:hypothetical protein